MDSVKVIGTGTTGGGSGEDHGGAWYAYGGRGCALDVNDGAAIEALIDEIVKVYGAIHVLVNNAGITRDSARNAAERMRIGMRCLTPI